MKNYILMWFAAVFFLSSCGVSKNTSNSTKTTSSLNNELKDKNRANITLIQRITQLPGVVLYNNLPVINKSSNSFGSVGNQEPLYVLNNQVIGNSFNSINELIENYNVKKIIILTGADAAVYGTQGSNGVIKITSY
ncbi:TonB-dependent receptor plug domain-containing protein [Maribacter hydrothermalis]|nr:TonB-dependent receptor plug domain-containing protein [Maribacter hydrothermalis]